MSLRTKLVLTASGLTFAIVLVLSIIFLGQLLHQRVEQTYLTNDEQALEIEWATRKAIANGLEAHPPPVLSSQEDTDAALHDAVLDSLLSDEALKSAMDGLVRYSPTVQDVSVTDAHGFTMVSTDPDAVNQQASYREPLARMRDGGVLYQMRVIFGKPQVLDIAEPLDRNHLPFLVIHVGVRSTFLRSNNAIGPAYEPWIMAALEVALLAILASVTAAALLSTVALRPLRAIGEQLEQLTLLRSAVGEVTSGPPTLRLEAPSRAAADPVGQVSRTIDRLGEQMRSREEGYTALQTNLDRMLDTLRDGVLLFAPDRRAVMVSDAVAHFLERSDPGTETPAVDEMVGMRLEQIFHPGTALGAAVQAAFDRGTQISAETVTLEDGRQVQISLDRIADASGAGRRGGIDGDMGTLLTLRDTGTALELEQELEVARRLAAIGRLTANVGHEVKNPINAMVVHLELLRGKLAAERFERESAQRHVDILADEMHRLDRVVQALADFSRPMELDLRDHDLRRVIDQTLDLAGEELKEHNVRIEFEAPLTAVPVRVDAELMRQAFLNLLLNAMQAMPTGGVVRVSVRRDQRLAVVEIADNGVGIPAALLSRIFDLYFTTKSKGSGIGLAMTYRIVQLHGGAMEVRSDADPASSGRGTTFTLHIPISVTPVADGRRQKARLGHGLEESTYEVSEEAPEEIGTNMEGKEIA
jgi:signal transduction histidine kinase